MSSMVMTNTFPTTSITATADRLPIEVVLISQLGHGAGSQLIKLNNKRQAAHSKFINDLDEPSAKLGGTNFDKGDATSLYSFSVGSKGHPFHCHAGHRIFTAIAGSSGTQLRFSMATDDQIAASASAFFKYMHVVNIPADSLFTVRFPGGVWHQFVPLMANTSHPALFAISCHSNELSGIEDAKLRQAVLDNKASIPSLTKLLPQSLSAVITPEALVAHNVPVTTLSFCSPPEALLQKFCNRSRSIAGVFRRNIAGFAGQGFAKTKTTYTVVQHDVPAESLLNHQLTDKRCEHEDCFSIDISADIVPREATSEWILAKLLDAFMTQPAAGVTMLMRARNILAKPLGLRTSPLGCPVSSLLSDSDSCLFDRRFPVLQQYVDTVGTSAEVILGADDKHLKFRSSVSIKKLSNGVIRVSLGTKVQCKNRFGRFYMAMIQKVHLNYVVPTMLEQAVKRVVAKMPIVNEA